MRAVMATYGALLLTTSESQSSGAVVTGHLNLRVLMEGNMRKMIFLMIGGFIWKRLQKRMRRNGSLGRQPRI
jgi:hypothetical protein